MPKLIENVRENIIEQARIQIMERGYSSMSIRSIAKACGIAAGTVYNYFPSKEMIIASFMADDWKKTIFNMQEKTQTENNPENIIKIVYDELISFEKKYEKLFKDPESRTEFSNVDNKRHKMLVDQLKKIVEPVCDSHKKVNNVDIADFIVETLLMWTVQEKDFSEYIKIINLLFA